MNFYDIHKAINEASGKVMIVLDDRFKDVTVTESRVLKDAFEAIGDVNKTADSRYRYTNTSAMNRLISIQRLSQIKFIVDVEIELGIYRVLALHYKGRMYAFEEGVTECVY